MHAATPSPTLPGSMCKISMLVLMLFVGSSESISLTIPQTSAMGKVVVNGPTPSKDFIVKADLSTTVPQSSGTESFSIVYDAATNGRNKQTLPFNVPPGVYGCTLSLDYTISYTIDPTTPFAGRSYTREAYFTVETPSGTILEAQGPNLPGSAGNGIPISGSLTSSFTGEASEIEGGLVLNVQDNYDDLNKDGTFSGTLQYTATLIACAPSSAPSASMIPSSTPTAPPSTAPSPAPSKSIMPSDEPSVAASSNPSSTFSLTPTLAPSVVSSTSPSGEPSNTPSTNPTAPPSGTPSTAPSVPPSVRPSSTPSAHPSLAPSLVPSTTPSAEPSAPPAAAPTPPPSTSPSAQPTAEPTPLIVVEEPQKQCNALHLIYRLIGGETDCVEPVKECSFLHLWYRFVGGTTTCIMEDDDDDDDGQTPKECTFFHWLYRRVGGKPDCVDDTTPANDDDDDKCRWYMWMVHLLVKVGTIGIVHLFDC